MKKYVFLSESKVIFIKFTKLQFILWNFCRVIKEGYVNTCRLDFYISGICYHQNYTVRWITGKREPKDDFVDVFLSHKSYV